MFPHPWPHCQTQSYHAYQATQTPLFSNPLMSPFDTKVCHECQICLRFHRILKMRSRKHGQDSQCRRVLPMLTLPWWSCKHNQGRSLHHQLGWWCKFLAWLCWWHSENLVVMTIFPVTHNEDPTFLKFAPKSTISMTVTARYGNNEMYW